MNIRCKFGWHREWLCEGFPLGSNNPLIAGVQCERCGRYRCVNQMDRPTIGTAQQTAFREAKAWLEKMTQQRVIGAFVHFR